MVVFLRVIGWFGVSVSLANIAIKIFGTEETVIRYAGGSRDLDYNISVIAFCLIFLALAAILEAVRNQSN